MTFFDIALHTSASLHPNGEPDDHVSTFSGVVRAEAEDGSVRRVGRLLAYRINADAAAADGESLFDVCDAHSAELHEVHTLVYEPGEFHFRDEITVQFDDAGSDTLILDYVILHPRWRGLRLGLLAARKLIDLAGGGCGLVVSHVAPLRHDAADVLRVPPGWIPRHETPDARKEGARKLRRYFRQMGFERMGRTPYYGLSMAREAPTLADLLRPGREQRP